MVTVAWTAAICQILQHWKVGDWRLQRTAWTVISAWWYYQSKNHGTVKALQIPHRFSWWILVTTKYISMRKVSFSDDWYYSSVPLFPGRLTECPYWSYWMNRVNCPHRADRNLSAPEELHKFAIKYAGIFQNSPTEIRCSEFAAELLLHSFEVDRWLRTNDPQKIYAETDIKLITSMISTKWFWERKYDFQWFVSALLHLAELTSMYKNKEVTYE